MEEQYVSQIVVERSGRRRRVSLPRVRVSPQAREVALYAGAAISYVAVGVFVTEFALSWIVGFAWLMLWVCGLPAVARRVRR